MLNANITQREDQVFSLSETDYLSVYLLLPPVLSELSRYRGTDE